MEKQLVRGTLSPHAALIRNTLATGGGISAGKEAEYALTTYADWQGDAAAAALLEELSSYDWACMIDALGGLDSYVAAVLSPAKLVEALKARLLLIKEQVLPQHVMDIQNDFSLFIQTILLLDVTDQDADARRKTRIVHAFAQDHVTRFLMELPFIGVLRRENTRRGGGIRITDPDIERLGTSIKRLSMVVWLDIVDDIENGIGLNVDLPHHDQLSTEEPSKKLKQLAERINVVRDLLVAEITGPIPAEAHVFRQSTETVVSILVRETHMRREPQLPGLMEADGSILFLQAIREAVRSGRMSVGACKEMERMCGALALQFATQHTSVVYISYLREAVHIVLGIINIGLIASMGRDIGIAAACLSANPITHICAVGWERITELAMLIEASRDPMEQIIDFGSGTATRWELQYGLARTLIVHPGEPWRGDVLFDELWAKYYRMNQWRALEEDLVLRYFDPQKPLKIFRKGEALATQERRMDTLCASLLFSEEPKGPLSFTEGQFIAHIIHDGNAAAVFLERQSRFALSINEDVRGLWTDYALIFHAVLVGLQSLALEESFRSTVDECYYRFCFDMSVDNPDEIFIEATRKAVQAYDTETLLAVLQGEAEDFVPDRAFAIIAVGKVIGDNLVPTSFDGLVLLTSMPVEYWPGVVKWYLVDWELIEEMLSVGLDDITLAQFLRAVYYAHVRSDASQERWRTMPLPVMHTMCDAIEPSDRMVLIEKVSISGIQTMEIVLEDLGYFHYIRLIPPEDWYDVWLERGELEVSNPFDFFKRLEYFGWSSGDRLAYLARIARAIASRWKASQDFQGGPSDEEPGVIDSPYIAEGPFYAPGLGTAIRDILTYVELQQLIAMLGS